MLKSRHRSSDSRIEDFKERSFWSCDQDHLNKLSYPHSNESSYELFSLIGRLIQIRRFLKILKVGRRTNGRLTNDATGVIGILHAYPRTFVSGETKSRKQSMELVVLLSVHRFFIEPFQKTNCRSNQSQRLPHFEQAAV